MAKWLQNFAAAMHAYRQTDTYQKNYDTSIEALEKKGEGLENHIDVSCYRALMLIL